MNKKDQDAIAKLYMENWSRYGNDLNPEIETTKYYNEPTEREDDDGVDWRRAEGEYLKDIYKELSNNGSDDIFLGDYLNNRYSQFSDYDDDGDIIYKNNIDHNMIEFFSFAFDIPKKKFDEVNIKNSFKKAGLDPDLVMSDEKIQELKNL